MTIERACRHINGLDMDVDGYWTNWARTYGVRVISPNYCAKCRSDSNGYKQAAHCVMPAGVPAVDGIAIGIEILLKTERVAGVALSLWSVIALCEPEAIPPSGKLVGESVGF